MCCFQIHLTTGLSFRSLTIAVTRILQVGFSQYWPSLSPPGEWHRSFRYEADPSLWVLSVCATNHNWLDSGISSWADSIQSGGCKIKGKETTQVLFSRAIWMEDGGGCQGFWNQDPDLSYCARMGTITSWSSVLLEATCTFRLQIMPSSSLKEPNPHSHVWLQEWLLHPTPRWWEDMDPDIRIPSLMPHCGPITPLPLKLTLISRTSRGKKCW